jgi:hypothetical protein
MEYLIAVLAVSAVTYLFIRSRSRKSIGQPGGGNGEQKDADEITDEPRQ